MMLLMLFIILMPLIFMMLLIILMSLMFMMLLMLLTLLMLLMFMMLLMSLITLMSLMSLMLLIFFKGELHGSPGLRSRWESASSSAIPGQVGALWLVSCTWKIVQKREEGGGGQTHAKNSNEFLDR